MFGWNFARSAESVLSRSVIRRLCKFLLKKKLGSFIVGDIDLDQLDIELGQGTIQLKDLALNVDYLNQKLHAASVSLKEGSISSLVVRIPWKLENCQIEVDGLELVFTPCERSNSSEDRNDILSGQDCKQSATSGREKVESQGDSDKINLEVHEGVKAIAKMVQWLLTSFHVKIKNVIVAFEPFLVHDNWRDKSERTLVLCIRDTEYGTCISEEAGTLSVSGEDNFLGMSKLTNFVKFEGAVIEMLQMDDVDSQFPLTSALETAFSVSDSKRGCSVTRTPILTGEVGGFSGNLKSSIPWQGGSLDINKVDADVYIDPLKFKLQPSTINWIISSWELLKSAGVNADGRDLQTKIDDYACHSFSSFSHSSLLGSAVRATSGVVPSHDNSHGLSSISNHSLESDYLLKGAHVIANWVPSSISRCEKGGEETETELECGASIDQFFECFDGMRSSHAAALGNSGLWNWTCSVFSAITAASSLATGSVDVSPTFQEQHHAEMILKARVAGVCVILSFHDSQANDVNSIHSDETEYKSCLARHEATSTTATGVSEVHYLDLMCQELEFTLQVSQRDFRFEALIRSIEVDECFNQKSMAGDSDFSGFGYGAQNQIILLRCLQAGVQDTLPPFSFSMCDSNPDEVLYEPYHQKDTNNNFPGVSHKTACNGDLVKVKLLKSAGSGCISIGGKSALYSTYIDGKSNASTSFFVDLPPFILWIHVGIVNLLFNLSRNVGNAFEVNNTDEDTGPSVLGETDNSSHHGSSTYIKSIAAKEGIHGNIFLPFARVMLRFPSDNADGRHWSSLDKYMCLDFSSFSTLKMVRDTSPLADASFQKGYCNSLPNSINFNFENLNVYLISHPCGSDGGTGSLSNDQNFHAEKILCVAPEADWCPSFISICWQNGPVNGPWIAKKAQNLITSQDSKNRYKVIGKGCDFASVTMKEHLVETNSLVRQEMILGSAFILHFCLSSVRISLGNFEYKLLQSLLDQLLDSFKEEHGSVTNDNIYQLSVVVHCDTVFLSIKFERETDVKCSFDKELVGSWDRLQLMIEKFNWLSVLNIGGINGANFFWVCHDEGELRGFFNEVCADASTTVKEFLLISCKNSTMRRGDGEGTNEFSCSAGCVIMHLFDPDSRLCITSITVRCGTIVGPGGRLDWVNDIYNFFSLAACKNDQVGNSSTENRVPEDHKSFEASFYLDFVDVALSYEPYTQNSFVIDGCLDFEYNISSQPMKDPVQQPVLCLLAASSFYFSNRIESNSSINYKIVLRDLGLLLCASSDLEKKMDIYGVDYLRRNGYVKIASEPLLEVLLRTNFNNGLHWELECSEFHVNIDTCCDTTAGVIRLASQLQQLFAPDLEESIVHLQNRWNSVHQRHGFGKKDEINASGISSSSNAGSTPINSDADRRLVMVNVMDEVLEDAFYKSRSQNDPSDSFKFRPCVGPDLSHSGVPYGLAIDNRTSSNVFSGDTSSCSSILEFENSENLSTQKAFYPEIMEGFHVSEAHHQPTILNSYAHDEVDSKCRFTKPCHFDKEFRNCKWYKYDSFKIIEDHVSKVDHHAGSQMFPGGKFLSASPFKCNESCQPCGRLLLKNIDVRWTMYDGFDWRISRKEQCLVGMPGRDATKSLEVRLCGMNIQYDMFPEGEIYASKLSLSVQDFYLYDNSENAPWKKVLGYYDSKNHPRQSCAKAFKFDLEAVRPDPSTPLEEYRLCLAFLPMRLHLDQSQLDFLISFFSHKGSTVDQSLDIFNDLNGSSVSSENNCSSQGQTIAKEALLPFFQRIDIWPSIVRLDYNPHRLNLAALRGGSYVELLNVVPFKEIELELKHAHAIGVYGWNNVCGTIIGEWLEDISQNQVHKLLKGLPPIRSLVALSSGAVKLVSLPVKSYREDKKLLKGMQRGAIAFLKSISLEAVALGVHLAAGAHNILLETEYILTNTPASVPIRSRAKSNVRTNQPQDLQQGMQQAFESISDGLGRTASSLVVNPIKTFQRGGTAVSALASAGRAVPAAAIAPVSATARAVHCALLGIRNSLDPERKKESMEKYSGSSSAPDHIT